MKRRGEKEPLLNVLARGVGRAAGKIAVATQSLRVKGSAELGKDSVSRSGGLTAKAKGRAGRSAAAGRAKKSRRKRAPVALAPKKKSVKSAKRRSSAAR